MTKKNKNVYITSIPTSVSIRTTDELNQEQIDKTSKVLGELFQTIIDMGPDEFMNLIGMNKEEIC